MIVALQFAAVWVQARSYAATVACHTALVAMSFAATGDDVAPVLALRFWGTVVGAPAGAPAARLVERSRAVPQARETLAELLDATVAMLRGERPGRPTALFAEVRRVLEPARLRGPSRMGRADRRAVERRIGRVARLVHDAEVIGTLDPGGRRAGDAGPDVAPAIRDMTVLRDALGANRPPAVADPHERTPRSRSRDQPFGP